MLPVLFAVLVSACGASNAARIGTRPSGSPVASIKSAVAATLAAKTAHLRIVIVKRSSITGASAGQPGSAGSATATRVPSSRDTTVVVPPHDQLSCSGSGVVDFATSMAEVEVSGGTNARLCGGQGGYVVITTGSGLYVALANPPASLGAVGAKWLYENLSGTGGSSTGEFGSFHELFDPSAWMGVLQASTSSATKVGLATLDGVKVTQYSLRLRSLQPTPPASSKAIAHPARRAAHTKAALRSAVASSASSNSPSASVWLDSRQRVVKMSIDVTIPAVGSSPARAKSVNPNSSASYNITFVFSGFGSPVRIVLPSSLTVLNPAALGG
ncbi:MAG: hypothetical protein ACYDEY_05020 [Acidimicrobiales bacterium]